MHIPSKVFFTTGIGRHEDEVMSFEHALRDAGIEGQNLVSVSSILPPYCDIIPKEEGVGLLFPGAITHCVLSRNAVFGLDNDDTECFIYSCVAVSRDVDDRERHGYLLENHGDFAAIEAKRFVENKIKRYSIDLFMSKFKTVGHLDVDLYFRYTKPELGVWTTVISVAVFI